jgi:hypothetical protein
MREAFAVWEASLMTQSILSLGVWLIPILAILVWGTIEITKLILRHQERVAKIERGIDPDGPWPQK